MGGPGEHRDWTRVVTYVRRGMWVARFVVVAIAVLVAIAEFVSGNWRAGLTAVGFLVLYLLFIGALARARRAANRGQT